MQTPKVIVWNLEDELTDRWAMVKFMQAVCEEVTNPVKDLDFEYFILECQRLPEIAKRKGWLK